uniref:Uncharacterized protein n=1 Tax=Rhizophora mucronata TaxID=61149 RepID=A0A2P2QTG5_RHIMU
MYMPDKIVYAIHQLRFLTKGENML